MVLIVLEAILVFLGMVLVSPGQAPGTDCIGPWPPGPNCTGPRPPAPTVQTTHTNFTRTYKNLTKTNKDLTKTINNFEKLKKSLKDDFLIISKNKNDFDDQFQINKLPIKINKPLSILLIVFLSIVT